MFLLAAIVRDNPKGPRQDTVREASGSASISSFPLLRTKLRLSLDEGATV